jgi:mannan endo-1,6-alpha-mannosidase
VKQSLEFQVGPNNDYMPTNQTKSEVCRSSPFQYVLLTRCQGNDDQSTWALTALTALERSFPAGSQPYLSLAQNVFNNQAARWDDQTCGGGLRWQIFTFNNGYNYKNSMSNGQFFEMAARLARATGNKTYSDWAEKEYTWAETVGLVSAAGAVYDGTDVTTNCTSPNHIQWTASAGTFLYGSAIMYNLVCRMTTVICHQTR